MHRAKKDAAEAVGEAAGVCRHNESQRWLDMRVGSPEDCCRDPPVVTQPPTSFATEESEGAPPLTACLAQPRRVRVRLPLGGQAKVLRTRVALL